MRKIIQIAFQPCGDLTEGSGTVDGEMWALCDDGTIWVWTYKEMKTGGGSIWEWEKSERAEIPQDY